MIFIHQRQSPLGGGGTPLGTGHVRTRSDHMMSIDRDREAWQLKHQAMKDQLSSLQDECRYYHHKRVYVCMYVG